MAVIRDVNLDTTSDNILFIGTIGGLCLIVAVLGIKLRWFKHRMTFNDLPTTSVPAAQSSGMEPQIIRATFKPSSEFDNYVEVTPPNVLPPVRINKSTRNAISLPPRKRQAPEVPALRISVTNEPNDQNEIEPLQAAGSSEPTVDSLTVDERRKSTPPPPLPVSPPPNDDEHEERLLLALEADYPYTESETIKMKEVNHSINDTILPSPPPYQENDPLAHIHFKKFMKKKHPTTPLTPVESFGAVSPLGQTENNPLRLREQSFDSSPLASPSPRENKLGKRHSFLNQVPTPTELPKLAFDFPAVSTPNLSAQPEKPTSVLPLTQSSQSLVNDQSKTVEKKSLLEYFGWKSGSKADDANKVKNEKKVVPVSPKTEKKVMPVSPKKEKVVTPVAPKKEKVVTPVAAKKEKEVVPVSPKKEKPKLKKIRVLKSDKSENLRKNEAVDVRVHVDNARQLDRNVMMQENNFDLPMNDEVMENRMEIDYFQKVKKSKTARVPVIVKSPKPEAKFEEKPPKHEVFRHEETFSAANGPLKEKKKKKIKSNPQDAGVQNAMKPIEIAYKDVSQISSYSKAIEAEGVPIPKPRAILKLDGFDDDNRNTEINQKPKKQVVLPVLSSPSSPSDTEDAWNLVAKHRLNTRAITATAISVRQKSESDDTTGSTLLQAKQLEMLTKPKTMREMKREQEQRQEKVLNFGGKEDKESDTEA